MRISAMCIALVLLLSSPLVFAEDDQPVKDGFNKLHQAMKKVVKSVDKNAKKGFKAVHNQAKKDVKKVDKSAKKGWKQVGQSITEADQ